MNITIVQMAGYDLVEFDSPYGRGRGKWMGVSDVRPGSQCRVELEVGGLIMWHLNAEAIRGPNEPENGNVPESPPSNASDDEIGKEAKNAESHIQWLGTRTELTGRLEGIGPDGECLLRLGGDEVRFEALGDPLPIGSLMKLETDELLLFEL